MQKKWKYPWDKSNIISLKNGEKLKSNWKIGPNGLLRFNKKIYILAESLLRLKLLQTFYNTFTINY